MWLAQYREATSDLTEALDFFRTVHANELVGYDGDDVGHIVDTLRATRPDLYPVASSSPTVFSYNASLPHNLSLSVPIVRPPPENETNSPPTATDGEAAATVERPRLLKSSVNRIVERLDVSGSDGRESSLTAGARRRRRETVQDDEMRQRKQLSSRASAVSDNEIIGYDYDVADYDYDNEVAGYDYSVTNYDYTT